MQSLSRFLVMTVLTGALLMVTGCVGYPDHHGRNDRNYGPPPHSAKHGYRQSYGRHDVRYDANLGVYLVVGMPHYYYLDNNYYRYDRNHWYYSQDLDKGWRDYDARKLPPGLAKKYSKRDKKRDRKRDRSY